MDDLYEMCPALMSKVDMFKDRRDARTRVTIESLDRLIDEVLQEAVIREFIDLPKVFTKDGNIDGNFLKKVVRQVAKDKGYDLKGVRLGEIGNIFKKIYPQMKKQASAGDQDFLSFLKNQVEPYLEKELVNKRVQFFGKEQSLARRTTKTTTGKEKKTGTANVAFNDLSKPRNIWRKVGDIFPEEVDGLPKEPDRRIVLFAKMIDEEKYFSCDVPYFDPLTNDKSTIEVPLVFDKGFKALDKLPQIKSKTSAARIYREKLLPALSKAQVPRPSFGEMMNSMAKLMALGSKSDEAAAEAIAMIDPAKLDNPNSYKEIFGEIDSDKAKAAYFGFYYYTGKSFIMPVNVEKSKERILKYYQDNLDQNATAEDLFADGKDKSGIVVPSLLSFTKIVKKEEIGGGGSGTAAEVGHMMRFGNRLAEIKDEEKITGPVTIVLGDTGVEIDNVDRMIQTERPEGGGDPKSDLTFLDANKNILFHISHKDGKTAKSAQQWGGISGEMATAEGVNDFVEQLKGFLISKGYKDKEGRPTLGTKGSKVYAKEQGFGYLPEVTEGWALTSFKSLFGKGFTFEGVGDKSESIELCDAMIQGELGDLEFVEGNKVKMSPHKILLRSQLKDLKDDKVAAYNKFFGEEEGDPKYAPAFFTKNDQGRNDQGIRKCRITIMPAGNRIPKTVLVKRGGKFVWLENKGDGSVWPFKGKPDKEESGDS